MALRFSLPASAILIACTGGGGGINGEYQSTQDRAPNSVEGISASQEQSTPSNEGVSSTTESGGAGGGATGAFVCQGTFACTVTTDVPNAKTGSLGSKLHLNGNCNTSEGGFNSDGTITKNGQVIATWHPTAGGGFSYSATATTQTSQKGDAPITYTITVDCTKVSDAAGDDDDDDDDDVAAPPPQDAGTR